LTKTAKAQVTSLDIIISAIILILLLGIIITLLISIADSRITQEIYGGQVFSNIENLNDSNSFIVNHKIDENKLTAFSKRSYENNIKQDILSNSNVFNSYENDVCIFFENNGMIVQINGSNALGQTIQPPGKSTCNPYNPCEFYKQSIVFVKPVLKENQIINMYIVVCE